MWNTAYITSVDLARCQGSGSRRNVRWAVCRVPWLDMQRWSDSCRAMTVLDYEILICTLEIILESLGEARLASKFKSHQVMTSIHVHYDPYWDKQATVESRLMVSQARISGRARSPGWCMVSLYRLDTKSCSPQSPESWLKWWMCPDAIFWV